MPVYDLIVVGAGLTGLKAAWDCERAGLSVLVLEARQRVGGRTYTVANSSVPGDVFDLGAHFIGNERFQRDIWDLVTQLKLPVFPQYDGPGGTPGPHQAFWTGQGANLQEDIHGNFVPYIGTTVPSEAGDQFYLQYMDRLVDSVPITAPWTTANADALDALSVWDWVTTVNIPEFGPPSAYFQGLVRMLCRVGFSAEPEDISMLWLLFYVASSGGLARFQAVRWPMQGAQGYRLVNGAQSIADAIQDQLQTTKVFTGVHVTACSPGSTTPIEVWDSAANVYAARSVLFALAPKLYSAIKFDPALGLQARLAAAAKMGNSHMVMSYTTFTTPFWRADTTNYLTGTVNGLPAGPQVQDPLYGFNVSTSGLSGDVLMLTGPSAWMMDNATASGVPALFAFVVGDAVATYPTAALREAAVTARMEQIFGKQVVDTCKVAYNEQDWDSEPYSLGCPAGHFSKGGFLSAGPELLLTGKGAQSTNGVFFASTETATQSNGYMDGAVWSGTQIATAIQAYLKGNRPVFDDPFGRAAGMEFCVRQILAAIAAQNPLMEWPVLDPSIVFHAPGGSILSGDFDGLQGTIDFYTVLGINFTITALNVEAITIDVEANRAYAFWNVNGVVNASGVPFRDVKGSMIFAFNDPTNPQPLIVEDWLVMDTVLIDTLASRTQLAGPPAWVSTLVAQLQAATTIGAVAGALAPVATPEMVWYGPGGTAVPRGPYLGNAGQQQLFTLLAAVQQLSATSVNVYDDSDGLVLIGEYTITGIGASGMAFTVPLLITVRLANHDGTTATQGWVQTDGAALD